MSTTKFWFAAALLCVVATTAGLALSDDDYHEWYEGMRRDITPVSDPLYAEECGSCHFAYPPGLLPAASWGRIMDGLADHFGENAELMPGTARQIREYLIANAADRSAGARSAAFAHYADRAPAMRITDTFYFRRKHHELPRRLAEDNPEVRSLSRCESCHTQALEGSFNEHQIRIPGFGRWED
jgi:hypothetical protein